MSSDRWLHQQRAETIARNEAARLEAARQAAEFSRTRAAQRAAQAQQQAARATTT